MQAIFILDQFYESLSVMIQEHGNWRCTDCGSATCPMTQSCLDKSGAESGPKEHVTVNDFAQQPSYGRSDPVSKVAVSNCSLTKMNLSVKTFEPMEGIVESNHKT